MTPVRRRAIWHGLLVAGWFFLPYWVLTSGTFAYDSMAYWQLDLSDPYAGAWRELGFFPYSPPIAILFSPLGLLPWPVFVVVWWSIGLAALAWIAGDRRMFAVLLAFPFVAVELAIGNIHLLLAAAIVAGFRWPASWAFVLLTKVTPGVGLLWFVVRREWRPLVIALGVTAAIVTVTFVAVPWMWADWISMVLAEGSNSQQQTVPLPFRMVAAAILVGWGAFTDRRWTVPVAALMALPVPWGASFSMLVALAAGSIWMRDSRSAASTQGL